MYQGNLLPTKRIHIYDILCATEYSHSTGASRLSRVTSCEC